MEVAVLADIHANLPALEVVLEEIEGLFLYCGGDLVGYNPYPNEVIERIRGLGAVSILGNHDHAVVTGDTSWFNPVAAEAIDWTRREIAPPNLAYLESLSPVYEDGLYMAHGSPRNPLEEYVYEDAPEYSLRDLLTHTERDVIVLGHTHVPFFRYLEGRLLFNPGSVGQPRDGDPRASYALLDTERKRVQIRRVPYDVEAVAEAILHAGLPEKLATRLFYGW
jgi:diadenosine tetraphosphatase ApaH/serine/threonine PP2A family protein phosphatase